MSKDHPSPDLHQTSQRKKSKQDPSDTREGLLLLAGLAADGNRHPHMYQYAKRLVEIFAPTSPLSFPERCCFASACAFLVDGQLDTHRRITKAAADAVNADDQRKADAAAEYLELTASEICRSCADIVGVIDLCILPGGGKSAPAAESAEERAFYKKMKGDFLKFMAEVKEGAEREEVAQITFGVYAAAKKDAKELPPTNPTRLELELSIALFNYDIRASPLSACAVAREAIDTATQAMDTTGESPTEATALLLGRLLSYIEMWKV